MSIKPKYRPQIIKKRTKKFIRHQSDRYDKLKVSYHKNISICIIYAKCLFFVYSPTGVNPRVLTIECEGDLRDNI